MIEISDEAAIGLSNKVTSCNRNLHLEFIVPSQRRGEPSHVVRYYPDGIPGENTWACDCIGFKHHSKKEHKYKCRHITACIIHIGEFTKPYLPSVPTTSWRKVSD